MTNKHNQKINKKLKSGLARLIPIVSLGLTLSAITVPANACQIPKSYYSNVFCTASSHYFLALKDSGQPVALINKKGKRVANLMGYDTIDVSKLNEGLVPVQKRGRVGYINTSGVEVIPAIYQVIKGDRQTKGWSRAVKNGRVVVKKGGKFGVINSKNKIIVPFSSQNKSISDFESGRATITTANGKKVIDTNGNVINTANVPTKNTAVDQEIEIKGPANVDEIVVGSGVTIRGVASGSLVRPSPSSINTTSTGNQSATNQTSKPVLSESKNEVWVAEQRDHKWGFVDSNNIPMIKFLFDQVTPFSEGYAGVNMNGKWGFVNLAGELVVPFEYEEADVKRGEGPLYKGKQPFEFIEGKAWVANTESGAKICINTEGKYVNCQ